MADDVEARVKLARAKLAEGRIAESQAQLMQAIELDPTHAEAFVLLAEVCAQTGDLERARLALEQAADLRPDEPEIRARLEAARRGESPRPASPRISGERPRVSATPHKEKDKGADQMRRSAAVEKDYLGDLVERGLLDVPNVTARPAKDPRARGRWRRRLMGMLGVVVLGGAVAVGVMYGPALLRGGPRPVPAEVERALATGGEAEWKAASDAVNKALADRPQGEGPLGARAALLAVALDERGEGTPAEVDAAIAAAARLDAAAPGTPGKRELAIARAARAMAAGKPGEARLAVDALADDGVKALYHGRLALAGGDLDGARLAFAAAGTRGQVAAGELALDAGELRAAKTAFAGGGKEPMALVGKALASNEALEDPEVALADLGIVTASGARVKAWKSLALATVYLRLDDAEKAGKELAAATGVREPRFLLRLALARLDRGEIAEATRLRAEVGETALPLAPLVDAELLLARGRAEEALARVGKRADRRGRLVRARALIDLGRAKEAAVELDQALKDASDDLTLRTWRALAAALGDGKGAAAELAKLSRASVSTFPRFAQGWAGWRAGRSEARDDLEQALEGNPLAYRAHTLLGEIALAAGNQERAEKSAQAALAQAPGYLPAQGVLGRVLLLRGKAKEAIAALAPVSEAKVGSALDELALAEAYVGAGQEQKAKAALVRAKALGAPAADVERVEALTE